MKAIMAIAAVMFILTLSPLLWAQTEQAEEAAGTITYIKGACSIKSEGGKYVPAVVDQKVYSSDTIKTERNSEAEVSTRDGNSIIISQDSEMTIHQSTLRENRYSSIGLLVGSIKAFIKKLAPEKEQFTINTVTTTAGIRGTRFEAAVREDGAVLINVDEGLLEAEQNGVRREISGGEAAVFYLTGEREDFRQRIDTASWRAQAIARIRENPRLVLGKMLEHERAIIKRLKEEQSRLEDYKRDWIEFLRKARAMEQRGMYREERKLIEQQIERTKRGIAVLIIARRYLAGVRSIIVLAYRVEKSLDPEAVKKLPYFEEIRREYAKINYVISRLHESEVRLKRVLFYLNKKYEELEGKTP